MKKRVLPVIMLLIMTLLCGFITVMAAGSKAQDGISVSIYTDKEQYKKDEAIAVDIVITNMNSFDLKDVKVKKILPEGVKLSEGIEVEETIDILFAGEQKTLKTTAIVDEDFVGGDVESSSEETSESESEGTSSESSSEPESEEISSESPSESESEEISSEETSSEDSSESESEEESNESPSEPESEEPSSESPSEPESEEPSSESPSKPESEEPFSESPSEPEEESSSESPSKPEEESSSESSSKTESEEASSQTPQQSEGTEPSSGAPVESESSSQSVIVNEINNVEIITPVMNLNDIEEEQLSLAEEIKEVELVTEPVIIQPVTEKSTEVKELEEATETEGETSTVEFTTAEQVSEETSEVVISEEEKILAETMNETENEESHMNVILVLVIGIAVIGCVIWACKKGVGKKELSILLCVSILTPMMAQLTVNAQELSQRKTLIVEKVIYIDGKEVELQTEISYLLPESEKDTSGASGSEDKEKIVYADGVIVDELKEQSEYELIEGSDGKHTVIIEKNDATQAIEEGSVFVLPQNEEELTGVALVAVEIRQKNNQYLEIICEEPSSIGTVIESIDFEGTSSKVDMNNIEILTEGITVVNNSTAMSTYGLRRNVNSYEETVELPDAEVVVELYADIETPEGISLEGEISFAVPEVYAKIVGEFGIFDNELYELEVTVKKECNATIDLAVDTGILDNIEPDLSEITSVELFKVPVAVGACGLISADLVVTLEFDLQGEAHLAFHMEQQEGIKYNNGILQPVIRREEPTLDYEASISGFCGPKVAVNIVLLKYCDAFGADLLTGAAFSYTEAMHAIGERVLICNDFLAYLSLTLELNSDTEIVELLEEICDTDFSIEIWDEESSPLKVHKHKENGKIVEACTYGETIYLDIQNLSQARKDMYRVMDSLTISCYAEEYQPAYPNFFWNALYDFVTCNQDICADGMGDCGEILVEKTKLEKYASGLFEDYVGLLEIPNGYSSVQKLDNGYYSFWNGNRGEEYTEITEWAVLWDGTEVVTVDFIYEEWDEDTLLVRDITTYQFTLVENPRLQYDDNQIYQYSVSNVERVE